MPSLRGRDSIPWRFLLGEECNLFLDKKLFPIIECLLLNQMRVVRYRWTRLLTMQ